MNDATWHDNDKWSILLTITTFILLVHCIYKTIATAPDQPLKPVPSQIALSDARRCMGNGDILLCYPHRGGGCLIMRVWSELIGIISRSVSEHVSLLVCDGVNGCLVVLENSNPMTRLMPIEQYIQLSHKNGLYVMWRPLRNGGISRAVTDRILPRVLGQRFPTPFQMFLQQTMAINDINLMMGNRTCIQLTIHILKEGGVIPPPC
jgi:hypothetical protein